MLVILNSVKLQNMECCQKLNFFVGGHTGNVGDDKLCVWQYLHVGDTEYLAGGHHCGSTQSRTDRCSTGLLRGTFLMKLNDLGNLGNQGNQGNLDNLNYHEFKH